MFDNPNLVCVRCGRTKQMRNLVHTRLFGYTCYCGAHDWKEQDAESKQQDLDALLLKLHDVGMRMRNAQKAYFKERKQSDLKESKRLEKEFDDLQKQIGESLK